MISKARIVKRSKEAERRLAKIVGGRRNPSTGAEGKPDVETATEAFELKSTGSLPTWLLEAWVQAERQAAFVDKEPILVLEARRAGGRNIRFYVREEATFLISTRRYCTDCKSFKSLGDYKPSQPRACRDCRRTRWKARRGKLTDWLAEYKNKQGCADCGQDDPRVLDFDHPSGFEGDHSPYYFAERGQKGRMLQEIEHCEIVCSNCHRIRTYERDRNRGHSPRQDRRP